MFDIILIQPPLFQIDEGMVNPIEMAYWNTMNKYSGKLLGDLPVEGSWGILSIGNYLIERGFKVKILDFHLIDFTLRKTEKRRISEIEILHYLKLYKSSFWGISVFTIADNWANIITNMIRKFQQDSYIFWGGYYPTENDEILVKKNSNIDFIVRNEGEETVYEIVSHFKKNKNDFNLSSYKGITFSSGRRIIKNEQRNLLENLDLLPLMDLSLYDEEYRALIIPRIYTSRGCENACVFCTANNFKKGEYRLRSPKRVVDEIELIKNRYNKNFFVIGDLEFFSNKEHAKSICHEIINRNLDIKWWCQIFPPNIDEESVSLMNQSGCIQIALGIESSNDESLGEIEKGNSSISASIKACKIIKLFNIQIQAYIMLGLPKETIQTSIKTIELMGTLLEKGLIDVTHIGVMVPYPGSDVYMNSEKYQITILEDDPSNYFMNCDFLGSHLPTYESETLSRYEIFALWLLALSHAEKYFKVNKIYSELFHPIYKELNLLTI